MVGLLLKNSVYDLKLIEGQLFGLFGSEERLALDHHEGNGTDILTRWSSLKLDDMDTFPAERLQIWAEAGLRPDRFGPTTKKRPGATL